MICAIRKWKLSDAGDLAAALKTETAMTATDLLDCIAEAVRLHGRAAAGNTEVTIC